MKYKILVVDDAIFMRERIKKILNGIDCETIEAKNGKEGCELFQSTEPDLVLLDISMPVMNGDRSIISNDLYKSKYSYCHVFSNRTGITNYECY